MENNELLEMVNSVKQGDRECMSYLAEKYLNLGMKVVKKMNLINAKSIYENQDYNLVIYKSLVNSIDKYEGQIESVEAFIVQRMKRDIKKFFSRLINKKKLECMKSKCYIENFDCRDEKESPMNYASLSCVQSRVKNLVKHLKHGDREVVRLLLKGYNFQEISDKLNENYQVIYRKVMKIRKKLKEIKNN